MQTTSIFRAALLAATFACGSALAVPQSIGSVAFDISWDSGSLGAGWTAVLSGEPALRLFSGGGGYTSTLTFSNPGATSSATWAGEFSVSIRPRTGLATSTEIHTLGPEAEYLSFGYQPVALQEGHAYRGKFETPITGGVIKAVASNGNNTLPAVVQLPSAYGYNQLSVTASAGAQTFSDSRALLYLDAASGNSNAVVINPAPPPRLRVDQIFRVNGGDGVLFNGHLFIARETIDFVVDPRQFLNPARWIDSGPDVAPTPFGGELDLPVELTIKSEVWTPTLMQPASTVRHCAVVDCMVAAHGQYLPQSFSITLGGTFGATNFSLEDITTPVPEPAAGLMLLAGLGLLGALFRRRATAPRAYFAGGE